MRRIAIVVIGAIVMTIPALAPCETAGQPQGTILAENGIRPNPENAGESASPADSIVLKKGSMVKLAFAQSLSSKHALIGEKVELRVADDVTVENCVVIPKGTRVIGTVTHGKKNEKYGNSKDLAISVDYIAVKDRKIKLTGNQQQRPASSLGAATVATIGFGLTGLMIYMRQREAWIREGTPVTAYTAEDEVVALSSLR